MKTLNYSPSENVKNGFAKLITYEMTNAGGSWVKCLLKNQYTKSVHVIKDYRTGLLCASISFGSILGSNYYPLNNLPSFIKNHIDFSKLNDTDSIDFRAFGLRFLNREIIK